MKFRIPFLLLIGFIVVIEPTLFGQNYIPNRLIIELQDPSEDLESFKNSISQELPQLGEIRIETVFPSRVNNQARIAQNKHKIYRYHKLYFTAQIEVKEAIHYLRNIENIAYAQPHYLPVLASDIPNDSLISLQRVHHELIGLYRAWDVNQGDTSIVIGIVDSGTDLDHSDLVDNLSVNYAEELNGLDDDGDGYVDNRFGWDLAEDDNIPQVLKSSHGVHMCGLVAAIPNNRIGVAGIGYKCRFLPVKIADDESGALIAAYEGVKYAADAGVDVINCSWGSYDVGNFERDIIDYALNVKNCLLVGAAGNDDENRLFYPAAFEGVMAVASTDTSDVKAFNSNFNASIDISAPGVRIVSTWDNNLYQSNTGTSVASAIVAGGAALVKSQFPNYSNQEIINQLTSSADYIDLKNPAYEGMLGRGRINLANALSNEFTPDFQEVTFSLYPNPVLNGLSVINLYWYLTSPSEITIEIFDSKGQLIGNLVEGDFQAGIYEEGLGLESFSSGLYLLRFSSNSEILTKKLIIE